MKSTPAAVTAAFLLTTVGFADARAEGPGACDCAVTPTEASPAPAPAPRLPRWGVGVQFTALTLSSEMWSEPSRFEGSGLHLRFRLRPRWVLEGSFAHVEDAELGDTRDALTIAVQFHPRPTARWDLYLLAGAGMTAPGVDRTYHERGSTQDPNLQFGGGVERRFGSVGVSAELRILRGTARNDANQMTETDGGMAAVGATYYF